MDYAEKLDHLLETMRSPTGDRYSLREISRDTGISAMYLSYLLNGERTNPSKSILDKIADFFHVPHTYFEKIDDPTVEEFVNQVQLRVPSLSESRKKDLLNRMLKAVEDEWNNERNKNSESVD